MEGEQIKKEEDEEEKEFDPEVVPFIIQMEGLQRQSQQSQYCRSGAVQRDFYYQ